MNEQIPEHPCPACVKQMDACWMYNEDTDCMVLTHRWCTHCGYDERTNYRERVRERLLSKEEK